jgi:hypothetical protein
MTFLGEKDRGFSTGVLNFEAFESRHENSQFSLPHYDLASCSVI